MEDSTLWGLVRRILGWQLDSVREPAMRLARPTLDSAGRCSPSTHEFTQGSLTQLLLPENFLQAWFSINQALVSLIAPLYCDSLCEPLCSQYHPVLQATWKQNFCHDHLQLCKCTLTNSAPAQLFVTLTFLLILISRLCALNIDLGSRGDEKQRVSGGHIGRSLLVPGRTLAYPPSVIIVVPWATIAIPWFPLYFAGTSLSSRTHAPQFWHSQVDFTFT